MLEPGVDYGTYMRSRKLQQRLESRPYDISAVEELVDIAYAEHNEDACILAIERSFKLDLGTPSRLYLMYGKCFFRRWRKTGSIEDIKSAVIAYQKAARFVEHQRSAIVYFELVAMQLRVGRLQKALDLLGVIMTLFRDVNDTDRGNVHWLEIAQYITGTILFASGNMHDSYRIYKDLLLHRVEVPDVLRQNGITDHVCWLPMRVHPVLLSLETARLRHRQGDEHLSYSLFRELWGRLNHMRELTENSEINSTAREDAAFSVKGGKVYAAPLTDPEPEQEPETNLDALRSIMHAKAPAPDSKLARQASRLGALSRQASRLGTLSKQPSQTHVGSFTRQLTSSSLGSVSQSRVPTRPTSPVAPPLVEPVSEQEEEEEEEDVVADPFAVQPSDADERFIFLLFGSATFDEWINDHRVFKKIGDMYRKWYDNAIMAAEFYAMASEIIAGNCTIGKKRIGFNDAVQDFHDDVEPVGRWHNRSRPGTAESGVSMGVSRPGTAGSSVASTARTASTNGLITSRAGRMRWEDLPLEERELSVYYLLDRAEALVEVGLTVPAEDCGHFCYSLMPHDVVVLGRVARCIPPHRREWGTNPVILTAADRLFRRVRMVVNRLKAMVKERRRLDRLALHRHGTIINSFIRMILTRNRTAGERLSNISIRNIWPLIKSLRHVVFKTGTQQILDWLEIWNQSSVRILCCFRRWYQRQLNAKFYRGLRVLQKIVLGQSLRLRLRRLVERIEEQQRALDIVSPGQNSDAQLRAGLEEEKEDLLTRIRNKRKIYKVAFQCTEVERVQRLKPTIYARRQKTHYCPTMFVPEAVRSISSATFTALDTSEVMSMEAMHELDMPLSSTLFDATGIALTRERERLSQESLGPTPDGTSRIFGLTAPEQDSMAPTAQSLRSPGAESALQRNARNIFGASPSASIASSRSIGSEGSLVRSDALDQAYASSRGSERGFGEGGGQTTMLQSRTFELSPALEDAYVSHAVGSRYYARPGNSGRRFQKPKTLPPARSQSAGGLGLGATNMSVSFASSGPPDALDESMSTLGVRGASSTLLFTGPGTGSRVLPPYTPGGGADSVSVPTQPTVQAFNEEAVGHHCISLVALNSRGGQSGRAGAHAGKLGDRSGSEQWVPFGILPDPHIQKLLESTVFVVTSPSFSVTDAKRISRLVRENRANHVAAHRSQKIGAFARSVSMRFGIVLSHSEPESAAGSAQQSPFVSPYVSRPTTPSRAPPLSRTAAIARPYSTLVWSGIKSLSVYGTSLRYVGLRALLDLGIQHLDSLTVSHTGGAFSHKMGSYLGERLIAQFDYKRMEELRANHYRGLLENFHMHGGALQKVVVGTQFNDNMYVQSVSRLDQFMEEEEERRRGQLGVMLPARMEGCSEGLGLVSGNMVLSARASAPLDDWLSSVAYGSSYNRSTQAAPTSPARRYNNTRPSEPRAPLPIGEDAERTGVVLVDRQEQGPQRAPSKAATPALSRAGSRSGAKLVPSDSQNLSALPDRDSPMATFHEGKSDEEEDDNSVQRSVMGQNAGGDKNGDQFDNDGASSAPVRVARGPMLGKLKGVMGANSFSGVHYVSDGLNPGELDREINETNAAGDFLLGEGDDSEYEDSAVSDMHRTVQAQLRLFEKEKLHVPELMDPSMLRKLTIEGEHKFGDRGALQLFALLQFNNSLQHVIIKDCKLTQRSVAVLCRYLSLTDSLQTLNLNNNKLCHHSATMIVHACANKGATGRLKDVFMQDQEPSLTAKEALLLLSLGTKLCVRVDASSIVDITQETAFEMEQEGPDIDDLNSVSIRSAFDDLSRSSNMHLASVVNMNAKRLYL